MRPGNGFHGTTCYMVGGRCEIMKRPGMIDRDELERRFFKILEEADALGVLKVDFPSDVGGRTDYMTDETEVEVSCTEGPKMMQVQWVHAIPGAWLGFRDSWEAQAEIALSIITAWYQRALEQTDAIIALLDERETFRSFMSGTAEDLDRTHWRPGMNDAEARRQIANDLRDAVENWWLNLNDAYIELRVVSRLVLTGILPFSASSPCNSGGMVNGFIEQEGHYEEGGPTWFELEKERLESAAGRWQVETTSLEETMRAAAGRFRETFKLFKRGSQTGKRGL